MYKQILLKVIFILLFITNISHKTKAQQRIGVEAGATISALYSLDMDSVNTFSTPSVGARAGFFFESKITDYLAIKTGLSGAMKGCQLDKDNRWDLVYLTVPVLAVFTPVKPLKIGIGVEAGALILNNRYALRGNSLTLGIRSEIAWQINPLFRLIAHATVDVTPNLSIQYTDDQGFPISKVGYNNISGGLSLAYTIKTFDKKG